MDFLLNFKFVSCCWLPAEWSWTRGSSCFVCTFQNIGNKIILIDTLELKQVEISTPTYSLHFHLWKSCKTTSWSWVSNPQSLDFSINSHYIKLQQDMTCDTERPRIWSQFSFNILHHSWKQKIMKVVWIASMFLFSNCT